MLELSFVVVSPTAVPTISSVTDSQVVTLGSDAVLTCTFDGNPSPTVAWFKDAEVVSGDSPKYSVSSVSDTVSTLTIYNVQPADLTSYQCHLTNKRGSSMRETFLCGQRKDMHVVCQVLFNHMSMTSVLLSQAGVPGAVIPTVEPFTKESVLITWDPPAEPNDDIELLTYNVYFHIRNFGETEAFTAHVSNPNRTRAWSERSVLVSGVTQQQFVVAYVVAVSAQGTGAVAAEQSYMG